MRLTDYISLRLCRLTWPEHAFANLPFVERLSIKTLNTDESVPSSGTTSFGLGLMLIAFLCFAIMDTSAKWLVMAAVPSLQVAFVRYFVHFVWVLVLYLPTHGLRLAKSNRPWLQCVRALMLFSGTAFNFTALKYLPLTTTVAIFFAAPMVVCLLSMVFLKERVGVKRFTAIAVGFIGVLFIVQPWNDVFDIRILLAFGALMGASGYFVMSRVVAGVDSNAVTQFYCAGVATVLVLPVAIVHWQWPSSPVEWGLLLLIGSLGMLGHSVLTLAHQFAEASVLAPTVYSQIVYITFFSWLLFDSVPDRSTAFGIAIIIASGIYIWHRERQFGIHGR